MFNIKKNLVLINIIFFIFLISCKKQESEIFILENSDDYINTDTETINHDNDISDMPLIMKMTVVEVYDKTIVLEIDNQSGYEMTYSSKWTIERKIKNKWEELKPLENLTFTDETHTIKDLEKITIKINLEEVYGNIPLGYYRIKKDDMVAEFSIDD